MNISKYIQFFLFVLFPAYLIGMYGQRIDERFIFPMPTGPHGVGVCSLKFTDEKRDNRTLMLEVWYPIRGTANRWANHAPEYYVEFLKRKCKVPGIGQDDLLEFDSIALDANYFDQRTAPQCNVTISQMRAPHPLIILSPGYRCSRLSYMALCQELASHGYIIVVIDHPNYCLTMEFDARELPSSEMGKYFAQNNSLLVEDIIFVINQMINLNKSGSGSIFEYLFNRKIDEDRIGILGHSLGSSIAFQASLVDKRIKAIASMDGVLCGAAKPAENFHKPCLCLWAEDTAELMRQEATQLVEQIWDYNQQQYFFYQNYCTYLESIKSAGHMIFTDFALIKELDFIKKTIGGNETFGAGQADGIQATKTISDYLKLFFDRCL